MTWIETIQLRTTRESIPKELVDELGSSLKGELVDVTVSRHAVVSTDYCIHLEYETSDGEEPDRTLGHRLAATLEEYGLISRSLWIVALDSRASVRRQS